MKESIRKICNPWFLLLLLTGVIHQIIERIFQVKVGLADNYLDPLIFMPIILHLCLWEKRILFKKGDRFTFSMQQLIVYFCFISLISEYFFPKWNLGFTSDIRDVICYGIGTLFFALFLNKPETQKTALNEY